MQNTSPGAMIATKHRNEYLTKPCPGRQQSEYLKLGTENLGFDSSDPVYPP